MSETGGMTTGDGKNYRTIALAKRLLREEVYPEWKKFLLIVAIYLAIAGLTSLSTYLVKQNFDVIARSEVASVVWYSALAAGCYILLAGFWYLSQWLLAKLEFGTIAALQVKISNRIEGRSRIFSASEPGYTASQMFFMTEAAWRVIYIAMNAILGGGIAISSVVVTFSIFSVNVLMPCIFIVLMYGVLSIRYIIVSRRLIRGKFDGMRRTIDAVLASIRPVDLPGMTADSRVSSIDEAIQRYRDNGAQLRIVAARLSAIMQGMSGVIAMVILVWGVWRMTEQRDGFGSLIALQTIFLTFAGAVQQLASAAVSMGADFAVVKEMYSFHDFSAPENWET